METKEIIWYDFDSHKPEDNSRVIVDIGGYTQSNVLWYTRNSWFIEKGDSVVEYEISHLISRWCYLPLSRKDNF